MLLLRVLEMVVIFSVLGFVFVQVVVPLWKGTRLLPFLYSEEDELEDKIKARRKAAKVASLKKALEDEERVLSRLRTDSGESEASLLSKDGVGLESEEKGGKR